MKLLSKTPHLRSYVSTLRSIPGGKYRIGASPANKNSGTQVTMSSFRMGATPVTWGIWKEYLQSVGVSGRAIKLLDDPGWGYPDNHPVVNLSWNDIMNSGGFCDWASGVAGFKLTLPTEAQWEYAARGGKDGMDYPWGNEFDASKLWCSNHFGDAGKTAAVDRTNRIYRNGYGLTDMVGNVLHWCADYHNGNYRPAGKDPVDNKRSDSRCVRGGSWLSNDPDGFRCADRAGGLTVLRNCNYDFGFRLAAGLG